jgi:O-antigen ligase
MTPPASRRPRIALGVLLLAAAAPWRYYGSFPLVASVSVLDAAIVLAGLVLLARWAMIGGTVTAVPVPAVLVAVLPFLSLSSLLWTTDVPATVRETVSYGEALVALAFAIQQTRGLTPERIVRMLRRFLYLLLIPPVLMLAHAPGFAPQQPGIKTSSGDYLSYFSRLSHPFMGRSNNLATVLLMLCLVLIYWAVTHHDRATYVAALVCSLAIALTVSRGAFVALFAAGLFSLLLRRPPGPRLARRLAGAATVFAICLVAVGWCFYLFNPATHAYIGGRLSLANVDARESRLGEALALAIERPVLGLGAGAAPAGVPPLAGDVHNTYVQQLLAYGVVLGLLGALSLLGIVYYSIRRGGTGVRRAVSLTLFAALCDFAVESSFEGAALRVIIYLLVGMLVGLVHADDQADERSAAVRRDPGLPAHREHTPPGPIAGRSHGRLGSAGPPGERGRPVAGKELRR